MAAEQRSGAAQTPRAELDGWAIMASRTLAVIFFFAMMKLGPLFTRGFWAWLNRFDYLVHRDNKSVCADKLLLRAFRRARTLPARPLDENPHAARAHAPRSPPRPQDRLPLAGSSRSSLAVI